MGTFDGLVKKVFCVCVEPGDRLENYQEPAIILHNRGPKSLYFEVYDWNPVWWEHFAEGYGYGRPVL